MNETTEITVIRSVCIGHPGGRAARPIGWLYECTGPDGRRFNNRSIVTLRDVLKRRYGRDVRIVEPWKQEAS